jgi:hypothetical protein
MVLGFWAFHLVSSLFFSSFIQEASDEDVHNGNALSKLGDIPVIFGIFFKCFAQRSF